MSPRDLIAFGAILDVAGMAAFLAVGAFTYLRLARSGPTRLQRLGDATVMAMPVLMALLIPSVLAFNAASGSGLATGVGLALCLVLLTLVTEFSPGARAARARLVRGCAA